MLVMAWIYYDGKDSFYFTSPARYLAFEKMCSYVAHIFLSKVQSLKVNYDVGKVVVMTYHQSIAVVT